jgi:hypothetical protein
METPRAACHVQAILLLFRQRRFEEALEYLDDLPPEERERVRELLDPGEEVFEAE